tara:strand:- start:1048 stop:1623 length:576 start_codon:yes stop_codon:yes gene_type:complete
MSFDLGTMWSKKNRNNKIIRRQNVIKKQVINRPNKITQTKKISQRAYWGTPTWFLFHTIAARIKTDYYALNYQYIWGFIKKCCGTLPCPFCRQHAIDYTNNISLSNINTKEKLQNVLFHFHNTANTNSGSKTENISILEKYNNANIDKIFKLFEDRFFKAYIGTRMFNDWQKNIFKKDFINLKEKLNGNFA